MIATLLTRPTTTARAADPDALAARLLQAAEAAETAGDERRAACLLGRLLTLPIANPDLADEIAALRNRLRARQRHRTLARAARLAALARRHPAAFLRACRDLHADLLPAAVLAHLQRRFRAACAQRGWRVVPDPRPASLHPCADVLPAPLRRAAERQKAALERHLARGLCPRELGGRLRALDADGRLVARFGA
jgi:hypothetical protein